MSLPSSLTVNIARQAVTEGTGGGLSYAYTAAERGALPTTCADTVPTPMTQQERLEYGVRGDNIGWKFLSTNRPQVDSRDQITWTVTNPSITYTAVVITRDVQLYPNQSFFRWYGEDNSTEN